MAKKGGIQGYTVQEAQNVSMGQAGVAYLNDGTAYVPPTGTVVVAIQAIDDSTFEADSTSESSNYASPNAAGPSTSGGAAMGALTIPSGMTIYGRFTSVHMAAGCKAILYLG